MYMDVFAYCVSVHRVHYGALGGQKMVLDPLELGSKLLQGCRDPNPGPGRAATALNS